jgi:hypothetical protein
LPQPPEAQGLSVCRALAILIASTSNGHYGDAARRFVHVSRLGTLLRNKRSLSPGTLLNIADARELPIRTDRTDEGGAGDLIVADVVNLEHEYGGTPRGRAACTVSAARCWSVHSQGAAQLAGRNLRRNKHIC